MAEQSKFGGTITLSKDKKIIVECKADFSLEDLTYAQLLELSSKIAIHNERLLSFILAQNNQLNTDESAGKRIMADVRKTFKKYI